MTLQQSESHLVIRALRDAANVYEASAAHDMAAAHFRKQASDARRLAELIERADAVCMAVQL